MTFLDQAFEGRRRRGILIVTAPDLYDVPSELLSAAIHRRREMDVHA